MFAFIFPRIVFAFLGVAATQIAAAQEPTLTIGLIGDSTVADTYGWGPAFAKCFDEKTTVLNYAKNGATLESLSKKLDELLTQHCDYVLIQFGHNDQKKYSPDVYQDKLRSYVQRIGRAGGKAIILSSVTRRNFDQQGQIQVREKGLTASLSAFSKAAGEVAKEQHVRFIDLHTISVAHHNKIGPQVSEAYNFNESDRTHFSKFGAAATAELIVDALKQSVPAIAQHVPNE